jgi:UDP-3-O-[3-hydroxymyristoyl] N-acetylglucosamine deacetylase
VTLARRAGPITFVRGERRVPLASLRVSRTDSGVGVTDDRGFEVDLVEHLLAALGGLGILADVEVEIDGPELPILDGGARAFALALAQLEVPPSPRLWRVQKAGKVTHLGSVYELEPSEDVEIAVKADFAHPELGSQRAGWDGDPRRFVDEIAPARTFGFVRDAEDLWSSGRAGLAALASKGDRGAKKAFTEAVLVFDERGVVADAPSTLMPDELARHKLLDLIGDLAFYGGPPRGRIFALRPGHTATHRIIREAISIGILSAP